MGVLVRKTVPAAVMLLACLVPQAAGLDESAVVRKIIESKNAKAEEYYRAGDIDRLSLLFAPDARQYPNHMPPLIGREAIRTFWTQAIASGQWLFSLRTETVVARADLAIERGAYTLSFTPRQGAVAASPAFNDRGRYLVHWRKVGKDWFIVADCPSSETPLPSTR